ncbi:MAG TPA: response regulator [Steroidobacteraceae bacterium]|nr:response regulator [Steroidobacteraceae bacterium]
MNGTTTTAAAPRLLIVDDEAPQLRALCDTLRMEGYATEGFGSPQQALAQLQPGQHELLLTDLKMPGMDGIELIAAARAIDPSLGAIVMTGHGTIDTAVEAMKAGALDYILKPFKLNAILPVLVRALDLQRLRRENALLQERERVRSQELAIAYRDLEAFAYSISHDLRAPLRAIDGFTQILQEEFATQLGAEGERITGIIREGSRSMDERIVGLLAFSRVGRQPLASTRLDMTALARAAASEMLGAYGGPTPALQIDELPLCAGDGIVMRQVWCNLIGNALKYSARRAQPQIRVSGRIEGPEAIYQVTDNGAGFDMRHADKLFGVFRRLHGAEEFSGTGVGLAIVHRIIMRHGGRIWAQAAPDAGASFSFALPLAAAAGAGADATGGAADSDSSQQPRMAALISGQTDGPDPNRGAGV